MTVTLIIIAVLAVIAFLAGMGDDDFWNLVNSAAILAISLILLIAPLFLKNEIFAIFAKAAANNGDKTLLYSFFFAMIFFAAGFILLSPLIWAWKEKEYYLILGSLASKTDYSAGLGISIIMGLVYGVPAGLCFKSAVEKTSIWFILIPALIATALSLITFIIMIVIYKRNN